MNSIANIYLQFVKQGDSSSGGYFADGSEAREALSFEGSTGISRMILNFVVLLVCWKYSNRNSFNRRSK